MKFGSERTKSVFSVRVLWEQCTKRSDISRETILLPFIDRFLDATASVIVLRFISSCGETKEKKLVNKAFARFLRI